MLDAFPEAVIVTLPGSLRCRALGHAFLMGMLEAMAERNAPGGFHLGLERAYSLLDPVSQVGIPREGDLDVRACVRDPKVLDYWNRSCTVAPGVWPLHMIETGGKDYPVRPWPEEMGELRQQMETLRGVAKRYIWSYSGQPMWHPYTPELAGKYGLGATPFPEAASVVEQWHAILSDRYAVTREPHLLRLIESVKRFDRGELSPHELCGAFGAPGDWMILGLLSNPFVQASFSAPNALLRPVNPDEPVAGRDGACRWFAFHNYDPLGSIRLGMAFDWMKTDKSSAQLVSNIIAEEDTQAFLHWNWDDGAIVYLNGKIIADHREYPERGHGLFFRDRYDFEEVVPVTLPKGESTLAITSVNSHGVWGVTVRFTDKDGWPIDGIRFALPPH